jgi:pimeloyl-ACP methyl ester carboxylesterase
VLADRRDVLGQRMGVVGHSFGARAALLLAMLDPQVAAVVSLDGGIGTASGRASLEALPIYRAEAAVARGCSRDASPPLYQSRCREHRVSVAPWCDWCNRGNGSGIHRSGRGDLRVSGHVPQGRLAGPE